MTVRVILGACRLDAQPLQDLSSMPKVSENVRGNAVVVLTPKSPAHFRTMQVNDVLSSVQADQKSLTISDKDNNIVIPIVE